jgi:hypothetical protein
MALIASYEWMKNKKCAEKEMYTEAELSEACIMA